MDHGWTTDGTCGEREKDISYTRLSGDWEAELSSMCFQETGEAKISLTTFLSYPALIPLDLSNPLLPTYTPSTLRMLKVR